MLKLKMIVVFAGFYGVLAWTDSSASRRAENAMIDMYTRVGQLLVTGQ